MRRKDSRLDIFMGCDLFMGCDHSPPTSFLDRFIWNMRVALRISFFLWSLWWDRIQTINKLFSRGMSAPNRFSMCYAAEESSRNLFIHCKVAAYLWEYMLIPFKVKWVPPCSVRVLLESWLAQSFINIYPLGRHLAFDPPSLDDGACGRNAISVFFKVLQPQCSGLWRIFCLSFIANCIWPHPLLQCHIECGFLIGRICCMKQSGALFLFPFSVL